VCTEGVTLKLVVTEKKKKGKRKEGRIGSVFNPPLKKGGRGKKKKKKRGKKRKGLRGPLSL